MYIIIWGAVRDYFLICWSYEVMKWDMTDIFDESRFEAVLRDRMNFLTCNPALVVNCLTVRPVHCLCLLRL